MRELNRSGPKRRGRSFIFIFLKFKSYPKRLIFTVTVSELRVRVSSKYYQSVFLIWSDLNEPKFRQLYVSQKIYFLKIPKSPKWHTLEVFWLVLRGSKYRRSVVNELALVFISFLQVVCTEYHFCDSFFFALLSISSLVKIGIYRDLQRNRWNIFCKVQIIMTGRNNFKLNVQRFRFFSRLLAMMIWKICKKIVGRQNAILRLWHRYLPTFTVNLRISSRESFWTNGGYLRLGVGGGGGGLIIIFYFVVWQLLLLEAAFLLLSTSNRDLGQDRFHELSGSFS